MVTAIRRTAASTVVTTTATASPASLFAWASATVAIIAETDTTGMAAAAMTGVEHLKSGIAPALFLYELNADLEPRSGAPAQDQPCP